MDTNRNPERSTCSGNGELLDRASVELLPAAPIMMTAEEIARCMKISTRTVWRLKTQGELPKAVKVGRAVRWRQNDILHWIEQGCPAAFDPHTPKSLG